MDDMINRKAAIDGFYEMASDIDHLCTVGDYISFLESLPAQSEIVRCKDCKHGRLFDKNCVDCEYRELATDADWFCADGERRING